MFSNILFIDEDSLDCYLIFVFLLKSLLSKQSFILFI